jgi:integrase
MVGVRLMSYMDRISPQLRPRCLKLPPNIISLLNCYRKHQNQEKELLGNKWKEHNRLSTRWNGAPMYPESPMHYFQKFCKRTGIRYVNIHSWRHFAATCMVFGGTDVKTVQSVLGHSAPSTTINLYLHSFQTAQVRAMDAIATALDRKAE